MRRGPGPASVRDLWHGAQNALLSWRAPLARVAQGPAEREAIQRFNYEVYGREQTDRLNPDVDHAQRRVWNAEDEDPSTTFVYIGPIERPLGSLRLRQWAPGRIPAPVARLYSLERFPDIDKRAVCDVTRLMVRPSLRGTRAVVALTCAGVDHAVTHHGVEAMFCKAAPGLLRGYRRLGLRPFGARLVGGSRGVEVPLIGITADLDHARSVGSPWYPTLRALQAEGKLPRADIRPLLDVIESSEPGVYMDQNAVRSALRGYRAVPATSGPGSFLYRLPDRVVRGLVRRGSYILDVQEGILITQTGFHAREMYVVLEGVFGAREDAGGLQRLGRADVFGHDDFFRISGQRSKTIYALSAGRLLVLPRGVVERLARAHPRQGLVLFRGVAQEMAEVIGRMEEDHSKRTLAVYAAAAHDEAAVAAPAAPAPAAGTAPRRPLLLAVDDDPLQLAAIQAAFRTSDFEVLGAQDGDEAIPLVLRRRPDLIIADIEMRRVDGFFLCQMVRLHPDTRDIPFIFLTAHATSGRQAHAFRIGADDFLAKPFDPQDLRARAEAALQEKGARNTEGGPLSVCGRT